MGNRNMAVKYAKATGQRAEYAVQATFCDVSAPARPKMKRNDKVIPRNTGEPQHMLDLLHDYAWKLNAQYDIDFAAAEHRRAKIEALTKFRRMPWKR